jgi:hypothetical protein
MGDWPSTVPKVLEIGAGQSGRQLSRRILLPQTGNFAKAAELLSFYFKLPQTRKRHKHVRAILDEISRHELDDRLFSEAYDFIRMDRKKRLLKRSKIF